MKTLFALCWIALGWMIGCGGGPTAPRTEPAPAAVITPVGPPQPTPTPGPCRPAPKCLG